MRLRTLKLWKKLKPVWLGIFGWAIISVVMMVLWGYGIMDFRGGLPDVEIASRQTIEIEKKTPVKAIDIQAEGVTVELGASYDIKDIQIQLYGSGYVNQKAAWTLTAEGDLSIRLDSYPVIANAYGNRYSDTLVMRILLPKKSYDAITIQGKRLNTALYQCKAKQLTIDTAYGDMTLYKVELNRAALSGDTSHIDISRSSIHHLDIDNISGATTLLDNKLRYWNYNSASGDLEAFTNKIDGIWEIYSERGNVYIGTRKWHQNLLLQLYSKEGYVTASSDQKPWKETIASSLTQNELIVLEGRGENMLCVTSQSGNILLETVQFTR